MFEAMATNGRQGYLFGVLRRGALPPARPHAGRPAHATGPAPSHLVRTHASPDASAHAHDSAPREIVEEITHAPAHTTHARDRDAQSPSHPADHFGAESASDSRPAATNQPAGARTRDDGPDESATQGQASPASGPDDARRDGAASPRAAEHETGSAQTLSARPFAGEAATHTTPERSSSASEDTRAAEPGDDATAPHVASSRMSRVVEAGGTFDARALRDADGGAFAFDARRLRQATGGDGARTGDDDDANARHGNAAGERRAASRAQSEREATTIIKVPRPASSAAHASLEARSDDDARAVATTNATTNALATRQQSLSTSRANEGEQGGASVVRVERQTERRADAADESMSAATDVPPEWARRLARELAGVSQTRAAEDERGAKSPASAALTPAPGAFVSQPRVAAQPRAEGPRLTIQRLEVQVVNQPPAPAVRYVPAPRAAAGPPSAGADLDRRYLGRSNFII